MKIAPYIALSASLLFLISCSEDKKTTPVQNNAGNAPAAGATVTQPTGQGTPAGNVALNPAHGQPGHRCDIEVGAPLNLPARPNLNPPTTVAPSTSQPQVAPGTNPPHGYPGHDCSVAVGAPLNK
ncbi:hypothetical protein [Pontibacter ruber]|uniref:Lipoprotein n=1 Tax=Pontibacter ruber TaxID=1343895 RepID=A0ABW5CSI4_9BACT|nr:hypothetical protein [Pontibacter ruber]